MWTVLVEFSQDRSPTGSTVCSTHEAHSQYCEGILKVPIRFAVPMRHNQSTHEGNLIHLPFIKSHSLVLRVLDTLTGTLGVPHGHALQLLHTQMGNSGIPHGYFECTSRVLHTLIGTAHTLNRMRILQEFLVRKIY